LHHKRDSESSDAYFTATYCFIFDYKLLFGHYVLIAIPFRSYLKPLIFLLTAPVAWCSAVIAHGLAGLPLSMVSLVGMIAVSGLVVNDSPVPLDYLKEHEHEQKPITDLICAACTARFRLIFLAFLTNFAGFTGNQSSSPVSDSHDLVLIGGLVSGYGCQPDTDAGMLCCFWKSVRLCHHGSLFVA
jgi:multidrug efflux pump subunit AcrB